MPKYIIYAEEVRTFKFEVEAESFDEAVNLVEEAPSEFIGDQPGEYLDESFRVDYEMSLDLNEE